LIKGNYVFKNLNGKGQIMLRARIFFIILILFITFILSGLVYAKPLNFTLLDLTEQSNIVFTGQVSEVGKDSATIKVKEFLTGKLDSNTVVVTPVTIEYDFGRPVNFKQGENVLIYANKSDNGQIVVTASGHGKITLNQNNEETEITAAKRIFEIASLKNENEKNLAMIAEAKSSNKRLRSEARDYVSTNIGNSEQRNNYKKELIDLINDPNSEIQQIGLQGIRYIKAEETISRVIELTESKDLNVVSAASLALAKYDTPDTVAALIVLTKHKESRIRSRSAIDLDNSRRPEAKEALKQLLYDEDVSVREGSSRRFISWLRRNEADDILPRLEEMLNDPSAEIRTAAVQTLGESRNPVVVKYLIEVLKKYPQDANMKRWTLQSLYQHSSRNEAGARELIDEIINLVIDALKKGSQSESFGQSFEAVGILSLSNKPEAKEALRWAAESHPNITVKSYAERCITK
jgi:hypothetical protein